MQDVRHWLNALDLGQYAETFESNDIDWDVLPELDHDALKDIGVASTGHRLRILKSVKSLQREHEAPSSELAPVEHAKDASAGPSGEAERRQLTVMFCDLAGSTALSETMDPEDYREVLVAYQGAASGAIREHAGYIARYMGDGLLVYFGYPLAHEDDPERSVRAGLQIIEEVRALERKLEVRVGIATGPVVVGDIIGKGASKEAVVLGETPNLAARLQGTAAPNTVLISATTHELLGGRVETEALAPVELKGLSRLIVPYRVIRPRTLSEISAAHRDALPVVGRTVEISLIERAWRTAQSSEGQAVLLLGEAGVGKSRVLRAFQDILGADPRTNVFWYCSSYYQTSANYPAIEQITQALRLSEEGADEGIVRLEHMLKDHGLDARTLTPIFAQLLSLQTADRYENLDLGPEELKRKMVSAQVELLLAAARDAPLLFIVEDLHWADPTTLEVLSEMIEAITDARVLMLLTARLGFTSPWSHHRHTTTHALKHLSRKETEAFIHSIVEGQILASEVVEQIIGRADGVPLFIEELTKSVLESNADAGVPASLQDSLMSRLDHLATGKHIAQAAAVIGREFNSGLLQAVAQLPVALFVSGLEELENAGLVVRRDSGTRPNYVFKHALIRDAAYDSLLRDVRRALHARIARTLVEVGSVSTPPELIARHYSEANRHDDAMVHWLSAGDSAASRGSHLEAISNYENALDAGEHATETPREHVQLQIKIALSMRIVERVDDAMQVLEQAEQIATDQGLELELAEIHNHRGNLYFPLGNVEACLQEHQLSLGHARLAGALELETRALGGIGDAYYARGRYQTAKVNFEQCLTLCRENGFHTIQSAYLPMLAYVAMADLELSESLRLAREGASLARQNRLHRAEIVNRIVAIHILTEQLLLDEAAQEVVAAETTVELLKARRFEAPLELCMARILDARGDRQHALERARRGVCIARDTAIGFMGPRALAVLALITDDEAERTAALREGELLLDQGVVAQNQIWFYRLAMEVALEHKQWDEVQRYATALEDFFRNEPLPMVSFLVERGRVLSQVGAGRSEESSFAGLRQLRDLANSVGLRQPVDKMELALCVN